MSDDHPPLDVAETLLGAIRPLIRRVRQLRSDDDLTQAERSVLARLERCGPTTSAGLARLEQMRPQSMTPTVRGLVARGLVVRTPDPDDRRHVLLSATDEARGLLRDRRHARAQQVAAALATDFTAGERAQIAAAAPLIERLARSL